MLIAAVADGAGSASLSDVGSSLAVDSSVRAAEIHLRESHDHAPHALDKACLSRTVRVAMEEARCVLEEEAERRSIDLVQFATTRLLVIHTGTLRAGGQIGDGAIVVAQSPDSYSTFIAPRRGEYGNQTNFLTAKDAMSRIDVRADRVDVGFGHLAMFTDGLQDLVLNAADDSPHVPFFKPMFAWLESRSDSDSATLEMSTFLESPRVRNRTDDDLTLLLARFTG